MEQASRAVMRDVKAICLSILAIFSIVFSSYASSNPSLNAGDLLRETKPFRDFDATLNQPADIIDESVPRPVIQLPAGVTLSVSAFRITGSTIYPSEELKKLVRSWEGRVLDVNGLNSASGAITRHYQSNGHILA